MAEGKYNPIVVKFTTHKVPDFIEKKNIDWVLFGKDNDYPDYLLNLYSRSPKHNAIINGKVSYICGGDWGFKDVYLSPSEKSKLNYFLKEFSEPIIAITKKIVLDRCIFGGMALEITWSKSGTIADIKHVDFSYIRSNDDNSIFYYTKSWYKLVNGKKFQNQKVKEEPDYKEYKAFNPKERKGVQLLYYKEYRPALDVYPLPDYIGANVAIETDIEINNYHYNNIKNGFSATALINFSNGVPQEEEKPVIEKQIQQKFTGTDNAGKFIINFSDGKEKAPEVLILNQSDAHHQFEQLRKDVMQEMFVGHRITSPMLFGVRVEGQLGGRSEIIEANELFQNTYVSPIQESINEIFNMLISFNGVEGKLSLNKVKPIGLDWFGSDKLYNILSTDERRELAGLKKEAMFKKEPKDMRECISMMMNEGMEHEQAVAVCVNKGFKSVFSKYGRNRKDVSILESKFLNYTSEDELLSSSDEFKFSLEAELTTLEQKTVDILSSEPKANIKSIAEALNVSEKKINSIIKSLEKDGVLKISTTKEGGEKIEKITPTKEGKKLAEKTISIAYSYEKRPGAEGRSVLKTTRDFCKEILSEDKLYTREEIEKMSNEVGYSVFLHTGGFWNDEGIIKPHCRHQWVANAIEE